MHVMTHNWSVSCMTCYSAHVDWTDGIKGGGSLRLYSQAQSGQRVRQHGEGGNSARD